MHWYTDVIQKYAVFSGRADRPEFWWFTLINAIIGWLIYFLGIAILGRGGVAIAFLYDLAVFLPALGVAIRRLHDTNRSGWWILIALVPFIGWIILLVFYASAGTPGPNDHGPDPKGQVGNVPMAGPIQS